MEPKDVGEQDTQTMGHSDFQKENLRGSKAQRLGKEIMRKMEQLTLGAQE